MIGELATNINNNNNVEYNLDNKIQGVKKDTISRNTNLKEAPTTTNKKSVHE